MDNKEQYLSDLLSKVERICCTDRGVEELLRVFREEYSREQSDPEPLKKYLNNLSQSESKQMDSLDKVKRRPKLRISAFKTAEYNFKQDIEEAIGELQGH